MQTFTVVVLAIVRILLYANFWETRRSLFDYYYIWLPAFAAWTHDCMGLYCFLVEGDNSLIPYNSELVYLKTILILFALYKYYNDLNNNTSNDNEMDPAFGRQLVSKYNKKLHHVYALVVFFFLLAYAVDIRESTSSHPFPFLGIATLFCLMESLVFVSMLSPASTLHVPAAKRNVFFLLFGCLITLLPLNTTLQAAVLLLHKQIYAYGWMETPMTIVSFAVFLIETVLVGQILADTKREMIDWPNSIASSINDNDYDVEGQQRQKVDE